MALSESARATIRDVLRDAPHGEKSALAKRLSRLYRISVSGIYRAADLGGTVRPRAPTKPEYREWTRVAVHLAHRPPGKPLTLDLAIEGGIEMGVLPPEAAEMPVQTARRIARELGLRSSRQRTHRLHADYPMQAFQVDASQSKYLVVSHHGNDGDWTLKLHRRPYPASGYKNKPVGADRMRLWVYSGWDMCTGYTVARYVVAGGETALDTAEFLVWAFEEKADPRIPLHGLADDVWTDLGPAARSGPVRDLLERLDVHLALGLPYAKERMGGVERSHRTRWDRFERALFLRDADTIKLSELNQRLLEFTVRENGLRTSRTRPEGQASLSRTAAWPVLMRRRPADKPLRAAPEHAIATIAQEKPDAHIDFNGILRWGGEYEVAGWSDRKVIVRRSVDGSDTVTVEDPATRERRTAKRYVGRPYGHIRSAPKSELDKLLEDDAPAGGADVYAPREGARTAARLPSQAAPAAALENPLDADRLTNIESAMALFFELYPYPLSGANHATVRARIEQSGLSRQAVTELAQQLTGLQRQA